MCNLFILYGLENTRFKYVHLLEDEGLAEDLPFVASIRQENKKQYSHFILETILINIQLKKALEFIILSSHFIIIFLFNVFSCFKCCFNR